MMRTTEAFHDDVSQPKNLKKESCCETDFSAADDKKRLFMDSPKNDHEHQTSDSAKHEIESHSSLSAHDEKKLCLIDGTANSRNCHYDSNKSQLSGDVLNDLWRSGNIDGSGLAQDNDIDTMRILEDDDDDNCDNDESDAVDAQNCPSFKIDNDIIIKNECEDDPNIKGAHSNTGALNSDPTNASSCQVCPDENLGQKRSFPCHHCEKSFARLFSLLEHIKINHEERYYSCDHCKQSFTRGAQLIRHIKSIHQYIRGIDQHIRSIQQRNKTILQHIPRDKSRTYSCGECSMEFTRYNSFLLHQLKHDEVPCFKCSLCDSAFSYKSKLNDHLNMSHGINVKCQRKKIH